MKWLLLSILLFAPACAHPNTAQLSPDGLRKLKAVQAAKLVNDATTAAIAANDAGRLSTAATATVLKINYQVLDVLGAAPVGFQDAVVLIIKNTRDALPAGLNAEVAKYMQMVIDAIDKVR